MKTQTERPRRTFLAIVMFIGAFVGAFLLVRYLPAAYRNRQAMHWPVVPGRVLSSRTIVFDASLGRPGNHQEARPEIRYAYQVGDRTYESDTVSMIPMVRGSPSAYRPTVEAKYPAGAAVDVRYSAADPTRSVLEVPPQPYLQLVAGVVLVASFVGYQIGRRRRPPSAGLESIAGP